MRSKILRRVSWQTDQLYRVEDARRRLAAARKEAREVAAIRAMQDMRQREREAWRRQVEEWRLQDNRRLSVVKGHGGYKARDRWIRDRRVEGMRFREIAKETALSIERVRQIWRRRRDRPWLRYAA